LRTKEAIEQYNLLQQELPLNTIVMTRDEAEKNHKVNNSVMSEAALHVFCLMLEKRDDDPDFAKLKGKLRKVCSVEEPSGLWTEEAVDEVNVDEGFGCVAWPD